jgi:hypothetical protein
MNDYTNDVSDGMDPTIRKDFLNWCNEVRMLGRDRMTGAFAAGWRCGYEAANQTTHMAPKADDHATG